MKEKERKVIMDEDSQKLRVSLYKSFLFIHVASAIKSGNLSLEQSYKYRPMDDYLIGLEHWDKDKNELLERAGLSDYSTPDQMLKELDKSLHRAKLNPSSPIPLSHGHTSTCWESMIFQTKSSEIQSEFFPQI